MVVSLVRDYIRTLQDLLEIIILRSQVVHRISRGSIMTYLMDSGGIDTNFLESWDEADGRAFATNYTYDASNELYTTNYVFMNALNDFPEETRQTVRAKSPFRLISL